LVYFKTPTADKWSYLWRYVTDMVAYVRKKEKFEAKTGNSARTYFSAIRNASLDWVQNFPNVTEFTRHLVYGDLVGSILGFDMQPSWGYPGKWEIFPGFCFTHWYDRNPSPECKSGCDFLTSVDMVWLLGVDLCSDSEFASLRYICPKACGCGTNSECPTSCASAKKIPPCRDNDDGQIEEARQLTLGWLVGDASVRTCNQLSSSRLYDLCGDINMSSLRAICPQTCGCTSYFGMPAGFFTAGPWGCSDTCTGEQVQNQNAFSVYFEHARECKDIEPEAFFSRYQDIVPWFRQYIKGLFQYLKRDQASFDAHVDERLRWSDTLAEHIKTGAMVETILSGTWELIPGRAHPKGKKGCEYLTSVEINGLLGVDLCEDGLFRSLRFYCPVSCRCGSQNECPKTCVDPEYLEKIDFTDWGGLQPPVLQRR